MKNKNKTTIKNIIKAIKNIPKSKSALIALEESSRMIWRVIAWAALVILMVQNGHFGLLLGMFFFQFLETWAINKSRTIKGK